jgi:RNA polymerase sigma-70 factor (ECF subfamily)
MNEGKPDITEIYEAYRHRIRAYAGKLVGEAEAEDLTQDVFTRVNQSLKDFRADARLSTWIYRIATNAALDRIRQRARCGVEIPLDQAGEGEDRDAWNGDVKRLEHQVIRREMNDCIRNVVCDLPERYRTVVILSEFEGFRNDEIAGILGVSLETVKIRLHRGRTKLREDLSRRCILYRDDRNEFACELKNGFRTDHPARV